MPVLVVLFCVAACSLCKVNKCVCHLCNKELLYFTFTLDVDVEIHNLFVPGPIRFQEQSGQ